MLVAAMVSTGGCSALPLRMPNMRSSLSFQPSLRQRVHLVEQLVEGAAAAAEHHAAHAACVAGTPSATYRWRRSRR